MLTSDKVSTTKQSPEWCTIQVVNGTPILQLPNGSTLPGQLGLVLKHPFDLIDDKATDDHCKVKPVEVTVTLLCNLADTKQDVLVKSTEGIVEGPELWANSSAASTLKNFLSRPRS